MPEVLKRKGEMMTAIPKALIDSVRVGEAVLFLGAGASVGALHSAVEKIPTSKELVEHQSCDEGVMLASFS